MKLRLPPQSAFLLIAQIWLLLTPVFGQAAKKPRKIVVPLFSCDSGAYAVGLPKNLPALRHIATLQREDNPRASEPGWERYRVLRFRGMEIGLLPSDGNNAYVIDHVVVTEKQWSILGPFRIGMAAGDIGALTKAGNISDGMWQVWAPGPSSALLEVRGARLVSVTYHCYSG